MKNTDFDFKEWLVKTHNFKGAEIDELDDDDYDAYRAEWEQYLEAKYENASLVYGWMK